MSTFGKRIEVHFADQTLKDAFEALAKGRGEEREVKRNPGQQALSSYVFMPPVYSERSER
jgi:hypothetical protein